MDRAKKSWDWIHEHMPGVVALIKKKRAEGLDAHVNECWRRGVVLGEPGWLFASEGAVSIGVPARHLVEDPTLQAMREAFPTRALLLLKEVDDGKA